MLKRQLVQNIYHIAQGTNHYTEVPTHLSCTAIETELVAEILAGPEYIHYLTPGVPVGTHEVYGWACPLKSKPTSFYYLDLDIPANIR